jgi:hypothetical protein
MMLSLLTIGVVMLLRFGNSLRAFVCITGQLSRLETKTKLLFLIKPNSKIHTIDVAFVLDPNSTYATNFVVQRRKVASPREVSLLFEGAGARVLFFNTEAQSSNPPVSSIYLKQLNKRKFSAKERLDRAQNHYRQYEANSRCNNATSDFYDLFIRLRDDTMFSSVMNLSPLKNGIHVPRCNSWGGINDRGAIVVGFRYANVYFSLFERFKNFDSAFAPERRRAIINPETFLAVSMEDAQVPIHFDCAFQLPFLSSHLSVATENCVTDIDRGMSQSSKPSPLDSCSSQAGLIGVRCSKTDDWIPKCPLSRDAELLARLAVLLTHEA